MQPPVAATDLNQESALSHLVRRVPQAAPHETVGAVMARLPGQSFDYAGAVFLVDTGGRFAGTVPMTRLFAAAADTPLGEIAQPPIQSVAQSLDQERMATQAIDHGMIAMPVVDADGRLLGVVPPEALMDILRRERVEDLHRLAGIRRETVRARAAIEEPPLRRTRDRLPWLLVGLVGSMIATYVVARFEHVLETRTAIAFFIPGIVYLADAIGTQTEAIAVRGLSLSRVPFPRLMAGELRTGLLIGMTLGLISLPGIWFIFGDLRLALGVALSLLAAGTVATGIGLAFPWLLARLGKDPAFGSGPLATIIQDVLSLLIYFTLVTLIVL